MIQIKVFWNAEPEGTAYEATEKEANSYLEAHGITRSQVIATHVSASANEEWTEYAITFVLEVPDKEE